ncbi:hypothetical protein PS858_00507 [Pseudomonas fluorescens]|uniref:Uncharacterized protein n=1 Tax=Pseudomonas fluorescens TaxID=294 RepID=A0A5E7CQR6_PSEFL|nr:hypothetical protein PS704_02747 [Pseudomonas fluorescens]VVO55540.1 hypothetical protein PS858_00507 [Pseudomonas fluorescens]
MYESGEPGIGTGRCKGTPRKVRSWYFKACEIKRAMLFDSSNA